jgi:hypothetical protein
MNLSDILKNFVKRLGPSSQEHTNQMPVNLKKLIQMLENTQEVELSCEDVYQILDQYAELVYRQEDSAELMPLVEHHIEICPDCREEFETILRILEASPA